LTQNAKSLYALLINEVLAAMDEGDQHPGENPGIEYRMLYSKAVEAFVCPSSEMAFRQLLREYDPPPPLLAILVANSWYVVDVR
jgi:origin recognition complex subunit 2